MSAPPPSAVPRPPGRPRNADADRAILDATFELIAEHGLGRLSIDAVAARAGVGKSTIYRRWPSRVALVKEVFNAFVREEVATPDTGTIRGDLVALVGSIIRAYTTTIAGRVLPDILAETHRSSEFADALREFWASRREVMFEVLKRGVTRRELPADIDYEITNELLLGPIYYRFLISGLPLLPQRAEVIVDAVLKGKPQL